MFLLVCLHARPMGVHRVCRQASEIASTPTCELWSGPTVPTPASAPRLLKPQKSHVTQANSRPASYLHADDTFSQEARLNNGWKSFCPLILLGRLCFGGG